MFMSKVAVVYWSGTGNTEAMAVFVAEGAKGKGADVALLTSSEFDVSMMDNYDAVAFKLYPLSRTNFLTPWTGSHISCP